MNERITIPEKKGLLYDLGAVLRRKVSPAKGTLSEQSEGFVGEY